MKGNFRGNPVVKTPPCHAGDKGSIPGQGPKIPQALEQPTGQALSPGAPESACTTTKILRAETKTHATKYF